MSTALEWVGALQIKDIPPFLLQGVYFNTIVAAFATFKKDTTLKRQGRFTLSTLQGSARAGERLKESNDTDPEKINVTDRFGYQPI